MPECLFSKKVKVTGGWAGMQVKACDKPVAFRRPPGKGRKALAEAFFCDVHTPEWRKLEYERVYSDGRPVPKEIDVESAGRRVKKRREDRKEKQRKDAAVEAAVKKDADDASEEELTAAEAILDRQRKNGCQCEPSQPHEAKCPVFKEQLRKAEADRKAAVKAVADAKEKKRSKKRDDPGKRSPTGRPCRCGHPPHEGQCPDKDGCWCDTFTKGGLPPRPDQKERIDADVKEALGPDEEEDPAKVKAREILQRVTKASKKKAATRRKRKGA